MALYTAAGLAYIYIRDTVQLIGPAGEDKPAALLVVPPTKSLPGVVSMHARQVTEEEENDD
jgi:hypothetical protein